MRKRSVFIMGLSVLLWGLVADSGGKELLSHQQGSVALSGPGDYEWWYACSPTSAGMMMGYYDQHGYGNLLPGDQAESETFGLGPYRVNDIIASDGHITDFYGGGYGTSGDDRAAPWHPFNCLADFMGTSQDAYGNANGATNFWNYADGSRLYDWQLFEFGASYYDNSGMYGIGEYIDYAGYEVASLFNQYIEGYGEDNTLGFTFADYVAEIDAGRPVMIHVQGHTLYGYGYDRATGEVILHDTWSPGENRMVWGDSYSGMAHYSVTALELVIPEPATLALLCLGGLALRKRRH